MDVVTSCRLVVDDVVVVMPLLRDKDDSDRDGLPLVRLVIVVGGGGVGVATVLDV